MEHLISNQQKLFLKIEQCLIVKNWSITYVNEMFLLHVGHELSIKETEDRNLWSSFIIAFKILSQVCKNI